jgi:hypothetical protein
MKIKELTHQSKAGLRKCRCFAGFVWFSFLHRKHSSEIGPPCAPFMPGMQRNKEGLWVNLKHPVAEHRRWPRLPLAIPVFVRGRVEPFKEFLEFATALNVSAGGMLVATRHPLAPSREVSLEIPSAPLAVSDGLPRSTRTLRAKVMRSERADGYSLVGLKFLRPLAEPLVKVRLRPRRKTASLV